MPSNISPAKRSVSSPQAPSDVSSMPRHPSFTAAQPHKPTGHKSHRPHVVGTHRVHGRTQSHKNLNKLQRLALAHNLAADGVGAPPNPSRHQRKKSAPVSPSTSPPTQQSHVRWNQSTISLTTPPTSAPMRKNLSTPALRRNSGVQAKKALTVTKAESHEKKNTTKSVGFDLADSDDEDEWEDHSSISASSTRRNSVVSGKMNGQNSLTSPAAARSPLVQESHTTDVPGRGVVNQDQPSQKRPDEPSEQLHLLDQHLIATRILQQSHSAKVPPSVSSISATATPTPPDRTPRSSSFANLASSLSAMNHSPAPSAPNSMIVTHPHATSSSAEGGVSRFLINGSGPNPPSSSDPATPSSFLPHYHPRTPPSPESTVVKHSKSPKPSANGLFEPHSRTQQKLWLQRTATMSNSPPDTFAPGLCPAVTPSAIDSHISGVPSRPTTSGYDTRRPVIGPPCPPGMPAADSESKRARKIYDRLATEYSVVRRFRDPVVDSFKRLRLIPGSNTDGKLTRVNSARDLASNGVSRPESRDNSHTSTSIKEPGVGSQFLSKTNSSKQSQVRFQGHDDIIEEPDHAIEKLSKTSILADGNTYEQHVDGPSDNTRYRPTENELLARRIWESREVPIAGE
ncbi:hypothetical protein LOZ53_005432 [Ophidiomyces ophidiicola]|nr:hypothetical protein LOZ55_002879 [Ophidiomyces ophidiicola]KAI1979485.1 hypothetical protein LOZ54_006065 [Ophidiomyces ophidiicola]KAI1984498.1 hypothetical protein LOZ53_005432 [Ophidiomyces ophidiicola]KAI1985466.1 hypothetical protein LOZ51_006377 [Ophidiomyces ophidiicola]